MQEILNQLVYFGFLQSLFLISIYMFSLKKRASVNGFMIAFVCVITIGLLGKTLYNANIWGKNFRLIALSEFSALLFGPTIYLFIRSVLNRTKFSKSDLIHYIPGVSYSVFILVYFMIPEDSVIIDRVKTGELQRVIYACHAVGLVVNILYWWLGYKVYKDFCDMIKNEVSYVPHTRFLVTFLYVTGFCLLIWVILFLTSFFGFSMLERNARPYIWIILSFIILFINYYVIVSPKVLSFIPEMSLKKYTQSKLSLDDLERLKQELDKLMLDKKPYLNNKLLKTELAQMLGVNNPELARLLNENIGMNFFEYVNYYRIKEFVNLASTKKAKQLTFFGLAQEAGFNSKTTFNKSFKKLMGVSPTTYFNQNT
ncbi:AraC family transcriptional regulator [Tenacibaculum sp. Bg11-29]|uniref:AraC family transcriptional regulator n=1 Tax=Tenacibaculum sp. Bg11-29 TaxID=2058306 RepID=UPI000C31C647|nr:helix-turn-helix domain-containing protein [Tenacibaculum sp. Bg11-29]PKH49642.1 AraC family transcriptional regulator [Tenacibaculum sp. Bg11-29]